MVLLVALGLQAQQPEGWHAQGLLKSPTGDTSWGAYGLWGADKGGVPLTLVDSLGLGNEILGSGAVLRLGMEGDHWSAALQVRQGADPSGHTLTLVDRSHLLWLGARGGGFGFHQEPLIWGYGLNGGYTLGEAAQSIPKLWGATPWTHLGLGSLDLGTWRTEAFLGQLLGARVPGEASQDLSFRRHAIAERSEPLHPWISGYRVEASFFDNTEFFADWINLFGGSWNGVDTLSGYSWKKKVVAALGLKDSYIEGNLDYKNYDSSNLRPANVVSASSAEAGVRVRLQAIASVMEAEDVRIYVTRGTKGLNNQWSYFYHHPLRGLREDVKTDWHSLRSDPWHPWVQRNRYVLPSPDVPNDIVGLIFRWPTWNLGLEFADTANPWYQDDRIPQGGHRSFEHGAYLSGFHLGGTPLGYAPDGESRVLTLRAETRFMKTWEVRGWLWIGSRPFRDAPEFWLADHSGESFTTQRFVSVQGAFDWTPSTAWSIEFGAGVDRTRNVDYVQGETQWGSRAYLQVLRRFTFR
jgi:hypothetical protein